MPKTDFIKEVLCSNLEPCARNTEFGVLAIHGQHSLNLFAVQSHIVIPEFRSLEVVEHECTDLVADGSQTSQQLLISFVVGGHVEWRFVAIVQIRQIGAIVGHAVDHQGWQLARGCFHCDLSIVENCKVGCAHGTVFFVLFDETNLEFG